jgi:hypothetical protein
VIGADDLADYGVRAVGAAEPDERVLRNQKHDQTLS